MNMRSPFGQLVVFVVVIMIINGIAALFGWDFRISIIGSLVLSFVVTLLMRMIYRD